MPAAFIPVCQRVYRHSAIGRNKVEGAEAGLIFVNNRIGSNRNNVKVEVYPIDSIHQRYMAADNNKILGKYVCENMNVFQHTKKKSSTRGATIVNRIISKSITFIYNNTNYANTQQKKQVDEIESITNSNNLEFIFCFMIK